MTGLKKPVNLYDKSVIVETDTMNAILLYETYLAGLKYLGVWPGIRSGWKIIR